MLGDATQQEPYAGDLPSVSLYLPIEIVKVEPIIRTIAASQPAPQKAIVAGFSDDLGLFAGEGWL